MNHVKIVISQLLVLFIISRVGKFIRLYTQKRGANEFPMIDSSSMCAFTTAGVEGFVVNESFKVRVDFVANPHFFSVFIDHLASFIIWKETLETCCTISIICS